MTGLVSYTLYGSDWAWATSCAASIDKLAHSAARVFFIFDIKLDSSIIDGVVLGEGLSRKRLLLCPVQRRAGPVGVARRQAERQQARRSDVHAAVVRIGVRDLRIVAGE